MKHLDVDVDAKLTLSRIAKTSTYRSLPRDQAVSMD